MHQSMVNRPPVHAGAFHRRVHDTQSSASQAAIFYSDRQNVLNAPAEPATRSRFCNNALVAATRSTYRAGSSAGL
jgi:hypothetical protein